MTLVGALPLDWDEVVLCLWDLLPGSYDVVNSPGRVWPSTIETAARRFGIPFEYFRVPGWESYDRGYIDLSDSDILREIFREVSIPEGQAVFVPDGRMHPLIQRGQPEIMSVLLLPQYLDEYPDKVFHGGADLVFLFPEARLITTMMHEGWFTHIACPSASNLI